MSYLIYTDSNNLEKTIQTEMIRIPRNLDGIYNLHNLKEGDSIYFLDFENLKIYGPAKSGPYRVMEEKNPKYGPFNGFGNVKRHYYYKSIKIECSGMYKLGAPIREVGIDPEKIEFYLHPEKELNILEKLKLVNREKVSIVISISVSGTNVKAAVVEINKGTSINNFTFKINDSILGILDRKKKIGENFLLSGRTEEFQNTLKDIGKLIYENVLRNMGFEKIFKNGGYTIDFAGDNSICEIPFEISYKDSFLFENNIIAYRGEAEQKQETAGIERVLILADPSRKYKGAYSEGVELFDFFSKKGIAVDIFSRSLSKDMLTEYFRNYDIVHFSGHCEMKNSSPAWDIGKALFTADDIFSGGGLPHLVFSNACGNTLMLGLNLLKAGIKNIISTRWKIPDCNISDFVLNFYTMLLNNMEIGYAFNKAILESYMKGNVIPLAFVFLGESRMLYEK